MGDYLSTSEAEARMPDQVRALYDDAGEVNSTWLEQDIDDVEGVINGYVGARYATPVTGADAGLLRGVALDLLGERAYRRSPMSTVPDAVKDAAKEARALLRDIAKGVVSLGAADVPAEAAGMVSAIIVEADTPHRTKAKLAGL